MLQARDIITTVKYLIFSLLFFLTPLFSPGTARAAEYQLVIARQEVNITGKPVKKITVNGSIPGPTLQWTEGEDVVVHVTNRMDEATSVHWHGILLPAAMDGVKDFNNYPGIKPGETFTYHFTARQSGTYWYHAHTDGQEQDGLYGALIIKPKAGEAAVVADRDYVVVISDFTSEESGAILANLKIASDYYNKTRRTLDDFFADVRERGFKRAWHNAQNWNHMRMSPTDLADVSGYTFLINGKTTQQNWTGLFKPGERVRLHFINASAMTFYDMRIIDRNNKSLKLSVVQADGSDIEAVNVDEFRFGVAETYDVIVTPEENTVYTIVAEPIDRSGFALATLLSQNIAPDQNRNGVIPEHRPRTQLTMADMASADDMESMDMSDMDHENMSEEEMMDMMADMKSGWAKAGTPPGNKALSYADLRYAGIQKDTRAPERDIKVHLGGNMERYNWTLNGKKFEDAEPVKLKLGERVRLIFINDTMMAHPMHLHGMFVQLENGQGGEKLPNKTVVIVPPGQSYSVLLTADEPGEWAFHCHLLYHMMAGMMNKVVVATLEAPTSTSETPHVH
jgi:FtsP/CotA-like multicopper oxidase with cupredoxin domain